MPVPKVLLDAVALLPETERQNVVASFALLEKTPDALKLIEAGVLSGEDYNRAMNAWKTEKAAFETRFKNMEKAVQINQDWYKENKPKFDTLKTERDGLAGKNAELEQKLKEAAAAAGAPAGDMSKVVDTLMERVNQRGFVTNAEIVKAVQEAATPIIEAERKALHETALPGYFGYVQKVGDMVLRHKDEFGIYLDREAFQKFLSEKGFEKIADIPRGYEEFTLEARNKKAEEAKKTEMEAMREQIRKEEATRMAVPGAGEGAPPGMSPLENITIGSGNGAGEKPGWMKGAEALAAEGKR
jgi:hypothetical protein